VASPSHQLLNNWSFWRWFGDSAVIDEYGRPHLLFHGTNQDFDHFSVERLGENTGSVSAPMGFFFTDSEEVAWLYADAAAKKLIPNQQDHEAKIANYIKAIAKAERANDWNKVDVLTQEMEAFECNALRAEPSGQRVIAVYLKADNLATTEEAISITVPSHVSAAIAAGADGLMMANLIDDPTENAHQSNHFVVFSADQILVAERSIERDLEPPRRKRMRM
jgi:hypothetical protein